MTTTGGNGVNTAGINTFADSVVTLPAHVRLRRRRHRLRVPDVEQQGRQPAGLRAGRRRSGPASTRSYNVADEDAAARSSTPPAAADGKYYMLTVAAPASGWLLRGMEAYQVAAVPRLRQHHVLRPARRVEPLRRPQRRPLRRRRRRRAGRGRGVRRRTAASATSTPTGRTTTSAARCRPAGSTSACRTTPAAGRASPAAPTACGDAPRCPTRPSARRAPARTSARLTPCGNGAIGIDNLWHDLENGQEVPSGRQPDVARQEPAGRAARAAT